MEQSDFGAEYSDEVYDFVKQLFEDKENAENILKLYFQFLETANGEGFEKMTGAISKMQEKHKRLPFMSFADVCNLMVGDMRSANMPVFKLIREKAQEGFRRKKKKNQL